jgi:hypothetical protein
MSDTLTTAFSSALELPSELDVRVLAYGSHEHWDSVGHMALVAEIEDAFGVMLDTDDIIGLSSYAAAVEILARHGVSP